MVIIDDVNVLSDSEILRIRKPDNNIHTCKISKPDKNKAINVITKDGYSELQIDSYLLKQLENSNFKIIVEEESEKIIYKRLNEKILDKKKLVINENEIQNEISTKLSNSIPVLFPGDDQKFHNVIFNETCIQMERNIKGTEYYTEKMKDTIAKYNNGKRNLQLFKSDLKKNLSYSNIFDDENINDNGCSKKVIYHDDPPLDFASLLKRHDDYLLELSTKNNEILAMKQDVVNLNEEICLFGIHKDKVLLF
jgi:hypothetical protein